MNGTLKNAIYTGLVGLVLLGPAVARAEEPKAKYPVLEVAPLPVLDVPVIPKKASPAPIETPSSLDETLKDDDGCTTFITSDYKTVTVCPSGDFGQRTIEYDAQGRKIREMEDRDGDGKPDQIETYEYNSQGRKIKEMFDRGGDGKMDQIVEYDVQGRKIRETIRDREMGGPDETVKTRIIEYDVQGRKIREIEDSDSDGKPVRTATFEYDSQGRMIRETFDDDNNGGIDGTTEYNPQGRKIREMIDRDGDGKVDVINTISYNYQGRGVIGKTFDRNATGKVDLTVVYFLGSIQTEVEDRDGDGIVDEIRRVGYGSQGRAEKGKPFYWNTTDKIGSPRGIIITETFDRDGDGRVDEIRTVEYGDGGSKVSETFDKDGDGQIDRMVYFEGYDSLMHTSSDYIDEDGDGRVDRTVVYEYSDLGGKVIKEK